MLQQNLTLPAGTSQSRYDTASLTFIGNATLLIECAGLTILTDPNFIHKHEKVPLGYGLDAERLTDPAIDIGQLPPLDFVLLSHFHGDHFDQVAERELNRDLPILTNPQAAGKLEEKGFGRAMALETWQTAAIEKGGARVEVSAMPGSHAPPLVDLLMPDVMGSILEFRDPHDASILRLYISGDTLIIDELRDIPRRYGQIDLALLHLGGTKVLGITVTMDGKQGLELMQIIDALRTVPIHYDDYDVFKSPLSEFQARVAEAGLADRLQYLERGQRLDLNLPLPNAEAYEI